MKQPRQSLVERLAEVQVSRITLECLLTYPPAIRVEDVVSSLRKVDCGDLRATGADLDLFAALSQSVARLKARLSRRTSSVKAHATHIGVGDQ
ncbi:hypothetical protein KC325_g187 [Hortaea werneckii]|nr:hypothetical protein KC325_g187 [Hortaea werneckii]